MTDPPPPGRGGTLWATRRPDCRVNDLTFHLDALAPDAPRAQRHLALVQLMDWVRRPVRPGAPLDPALPISRLRELLQRLGAEPAQAAHLQGFLAAVAREVDAPALLADHGFARQASLFSEVRRRLALRWLPRTPDTDDLGELVQLLFRPEDAAWLRVLPTELLEPLGQLLGTALPQGWPAALHDALMLLGSAVAGAAHGHDLRRRMDPVLLQSRPFRQLPTALLALRAAQDAGDAAETLRQAAYLRALLEACREAANSVFQHLEAHGVSVDIVFAAEQLKSRLARMELLLNALLSPPASGAWRALLVQLVEINGQSGVRRLMGEQFSLMARQMAERHAETGEHYITTDRAGYRDMLRRAAGGGLVIAGTTFAKFAIAAVGLGAFWTGLWSGVNYAISFLIVMLLHWTVATKQPAMTAPALADSLAGLKPNRDDAEEDVAIEGFVDRVAQLIRSQFAGIVGNVAICGPVVLVVQLLAQQFNGAPLVGEAKAHYVLHSLHLWGPTLLFAAFTGVLLFLSSMVAGWAENAFVFHRMESTLAWNPRITRMLGPARAQRWAGWWRRNISGVVANTSLGLMLGLVPALLAFVGLGLEVRHVTLSTGQLAAALGALGPSLLATAEFWWCMAALVGIGVLNLGVSFWLALRVAIRSRGVQVRDRSRLRAALWRRVRQAPLSFLRPPPEWR